jgi:hypothetical protein
MDSSDLITENILYFPFDQQTDVKNKADSEDQTKVETTTESIVKTKENSRNLN